MEKLKVLLTTEGTYPFHQGGVSTWCDILVQKLDSIEYIIYSVMMDPFVSLKFNLPKRAQLIKMPLWGTEEPSEHLTTPFSITYLKKKRTSKQVIKTFFIPLFKEMIREFLKTEKNPHYLADILLQMHHFFQEYEYKVSFKSEETWDAFKEIVREMVDDKSRDLPEPDIFGLIQSLGWIYRFLNILNTPIPRVNVSHASAAAFCGIPAVLAKLEYKTPILLTEHGVYLREQYLSLAKRQLSTYLNTFLIRFIHSITTLNYSLADQVSPVCHYNTRWEKQFGVTPDKIDVIYNGIDNKIFTDTNKVKPLNPTVVTVARIDPIKDMMTLMRAIHIVKKSIPNIRLLIYGSVSVPTYYDECLALRSELDLTENVIFAGHTNNIVQAYHSGDVVALSSISEAFPYSVIEAMMCGKPVVTTNVGGVPEALGDTGILVEPRQPEDFAKGLLKLLNNERLRVDLGEEARRRALKFFTLDQVLEHHYKSYVKLALQSEWLGGPILPTNETNTTIDLEVAVKNALDKQFGKRQGSFKESEQILLIEKAYLFLDIGHPKQALEFFIKAIDINPMAPSVPVILAEVAKIKSSIGEIPQAFFELDKMESILALQTV